MNSAKSNALRFETIIATPTSPRPEPLSPRHVIIDEPKVRNKPIFSHFLQMKNPQEIAFARFSYHDPNQQIPRNVQKRESQQGRKFLQSSSGMGVTAAASIGLAPLTGGTSLLVGAGIGGISTLKTGYHGYQKRQFKKSRQQLIQTLSPEINALLATHANQFLKSRITPDHQLTSLTYSFTYQSREYEKWLPQQLRPVPKEKTIHFETTSVHLDEMSKLSEMSRFCDKIASQILQDFGQHPDKPTVTLQMEVPALRPCQSHMARCELRIVTY